MRAGRLSYAEQRRLKGLAVQAAPIAPAAPGANGGWTPGLQLVAFRHLRISAFNPRTRVDEAEIAALAENIAARDIMQNLVVRPEGDALGIIAGGRRYRALAALVAAGRFPADHPVPVNIIFLGDREALERAIEENDQRQQLSALEQGAAYAQDLELGADIDSIAVAAGRSRKFIVQRLSFHTRLSDAVKDAVANDRITLGYAEEFTVGERDEQDKVLADLLTHPGSFRPGAVRAMLIGPYIPLSRARFDLALYRGARRRDLFGEEDYAEDRAEFARLQRDAAERLKTELAEEWAWVELRQGSARLDLFAYRQGALAAEGAGAIVHLRDDLSISVYTGLKKPEPVAAPHREPRIVPAPPGRGPGVTKLLAEGPVATTTPQPAEDPPGEVWTTFSVEHLRWARLQRSHRLQGAIAWRPDVVMALAILGLLDCSEIGIHPVYPPGAASKAVRSPKIDAEIDRLLPAELDLVAERPELAFQALMTMLPERRQALFGMLVARQIVCVPEDGAAASLGDSPMTVAVAEEVEATPPTGNWLQPDYLERLSLGGLKWVARAVGIPEAEHAETRGEAIEIINWAERQAHAAAFDPPELRIAAASDIKAALSAGGE